MSISSRKHNYIEIMMHVKPGDVLKVRSREWYDENQGNGFVIPPGGYRVFSMYMADFCGCILTVERVYPARGGIMHFPTIVAKELPGFAWEPWMFDEFPDPFNETDQIEARQKNPTTSYASIDPRDFLVQFPGDVELHPFGIGRLQIAND